MFICFYTFLRFDLFRKVLGAIRIPEREKITSSQEFLHKPAGKTGGVNKECFILLIEQVNANIFFQ